MEQLREADPLAALREQVTYAQLLDAQERALRLFVLPRTAGWDALHRAPGFKVWLQRMDDVGRTGAERRRAAMPGGRGGSRIARNYSSLFLEPRGAYVRVVCRHDSAIAAGASSQEATFACWIAHALCKAGIAQVQQGALLDQTTPRRYDGDYGLLAHWKDRHLARLAERLGEVPYAAAQVLRVVQRREAGLYRAQESGEQSTEKEGGGGELARGNGGAHVLPMLLGGLCKSTRVT